MRTLFVVFFFFNLFVISFCFCDELIRISVVVPCDRVHIRFLPELLNALESQSYVPDEVIISISNSGDQDDFLITQIQQNRFSFLLKILRTSKRQFAGENRNIAILNSSGSLIICQDADDLPHQQRVAIIKTLFQETSFDFLLHLFVKPIDELAIDQYIEYFKNLQFPLNNHEILRISPQDDLFDIGHTHFEFFTKYSLFQIPSTLGIHFGNCAFKRTVFDKIQYSHRPSGQDVEFFSKVISIFHNTLITNLPLVYYIRPRSTYYFGRELLIPSI